MARARRWRSIALLVAALAAGWSGAASAQVIGRLQSTHPSAPPPDEGLGPRDVFLEADTLIDDHPTNTVTAVGHVQARFQGRTLRADKVTYNTVTGVAHAVGHAVVVNADGTSEYGRDILLDDQFRAAVAYGFAVRQQDNITIAAGAAIRRNDVVDQLNDAVYTVCNICAPDGSPKQPTWSIQATRIVQDRKHQVIYYRNAVIRVLGVPIFYAPVFWHPDPTAPARSGLLAPKIEFSRRRGFSYEQPYLFVISPYNDLIVSPQINTRVYPLLNLEYLERFYSGMIDIRGGYTYESDFDNHNFYGPKSSRSYILGRGLFDITSDWQWGFGLERVTDPTFFARYGIHDVYTDRGPYPTDTDRLISQLFTDREDDDSYVSVAALDFQTLRAYGRNPDGSIIAENNKAFPFVGPLAEARYDPSEPLLGGQLHVTANAVDLVRNELVLNVEDPLGVVPSGAQLFTTTALNGISGTANDAHDRQVTALSYTDARRASLEADWRRTFTLDNGMQLQPFLVGRGDIFSIADSTLYDFSSGSPVASPGKDVVARGLPTLGANFSWPFIRTFGAGGSSLVLEPLAQIALSPTLGLNRYIPDEDSVSFEYDESNLFSIDRFAGFDLLESGQRLNVGGRATMDWGAGQSASLLVGRTFRAEPDPEFDALSGLQGTTSDWVTAATVTPLVGLSFFTRARLDSDTLAVRRDETGVDFGIPRLNGSFRYDYNEAGYSVSPTGQTSIGQTQDVSFSGTAFFTQHWGVSANVTRDLQLRDFPIAQIGLVYLDECIRLDVLFTHDETYGSVIGTSNSVTLRLTLATLGDTSSVGSNRAGSR